MSLPLLRSFSRLASQRTPAVHQTRLYSAPTSNSIPPSKAKYVPTSGTYPQGFLCSAAHVGVKPSTPPTHDDLALIASEKPCAAAAVFTQNRFQAAPVTVSRDVIKERKGEGIRAVVVNSGCANAVTGKGGIEDAVRMGNETDRCFGEEQSNASSRSLVMSTGVIGQRLPIQKISSRIPLAHSTLGSSHDYWLRAARAICTTDTFPKLLSTSFTLPSSPGKTYHLAGMTKGAGMIHPNMATLLGILCTDVPISASALQPLLSGAIDKSFNSISIDGDTSTNDTVCLLANGAAGGQPITSPSSPDFAAFKDVLTSFSQSLSHLIVRDGEGATKFVTIRVTNSPSYPGAKAIASSIARSPLVKTALYGKDANWGRILCATGYTAGVDPSVIIPEETSVSFKPNDSSDELKLLVNGEPQNVDEARAASILEHEDLEICVKLRREAGQGKDEEAKYWTCDFSHEYVTINGDYRT